jgi:peptidoglycan hydrolase CwlO-like protein
MATILLVSVLVIGLIALHNDSAAAKWHRLDAAQLQISGNAKRQVGLANANISTLNSEVKSLDGQVSTMQSQLSSVANQKEKAIDKTTVYAQLLSAAGQVANDLQSCIADTNHLYNDLVRAAPADLQSLQSEAQGVASTCGRAETDNSVVQSAIQSASSSPVS